MKHFKANIGVALRCLLMAFFHTLHAFIPCEQTSHKYWGFNYKGDEDEEPATPSQPPA